MALYENVSAPLTMCFRAISTPRGIRIVQHLDTDFQRWKESFETLIIFVDHRIDLNPHTSTNLSASQICSYQGKYHALVYYFTRLPYIRAKGLYGSLRWSNLSPTSTMDVHMHHNHHTHHHPIDAPQDSPSSMVPWYTTYIKIDDTPMSNHWHRDRKGTTNDDSTTNDVSTTNDDVLHLRPRSPSQCLIVPTNLNVSNDGRIQYRPSNHGRPRWG